MDFECEICYNAFEEVDLRAPLVLPCGHTYCMGCIENFHSHVCPSCKHPIHAAGETSVVLPRNNLLIRYMVESRQKSGEKSNEKSEEKSKVKPKEKTKVKSSKKESAGAPKVKPNGQRVLFKQLDRAFSNATPSTSSPTSRDQRLEERLFLLNLSRICKERKAQDESFDTKRFVAQGLISKFGEETARRILHEVFGRIQVLRERNAMSVSNEVTV